MNNFFNFGPKTTFLASKLPLRPAQCFEFDMPDLKGHSNNTSGEGGRKCVK